MSEFQSGTVQEIKTSTMRNGKEKYDIVLTAPHLKWPVNIGSFNPVDLKAGDEVTVEIAMNGKFRNYVGHTMGIQPYKAGGNAPAASGSGGNQGTSAAPAAPQRGSYGKSFPIPADHPDRAIIRQNAVTRAVDVVMGIESSMYQTAEQAAGRIVDIAEIFESYYSGDRELEAAKEMAADLGINPANLA